MNIIYSILLIILSCVAFLQAFKELSTNRGLLRNFWIFASASFFGAISVIKIYDIFMFRDAQITDILLHVAFLGLAIRYYFSPNCLTSAKTCLMVGDAEIGKNHRSSCLLK